MADIDEFVDLVVSHFDQMAWFTPWVATPPAPLPRPHAASAAAVVVPEELPEENEDAFDFGFDRNIDQEALRQGSEAQARLARRLSMCLVRALLDQRTAQRRASRKGPRLELNRSGGKNRTRDRALSSRELFSERERMRKAGRKEKDFTRDDILPMIWKAFNNYDKDATGLIDRKEFKAVMEGLGIVPQTLGASFATLMALVDEDGNGHIDYDEFLDFIMSHFDRSAWLLFMPNVEGMDRAQVLSKREMVQLISLRVAQDVDPRTINRDGVLPRAILSEHLNDVFRSFDVDNSGMLDPLEFWEALSGIGDTNIALDPGVMELIDIDGSGSINYEEFSRFMHEFFDNSVLVPIANRGVRPGASSSRGGAVFSVADYRREEAERRDAQRKLEDSSPSEVQSSDERELSNEVESAESQENSDSEGGVVSSDNSDRGSDFSDLFVSEEQANEVLGKLDDILREEDRDISAQELQRLHASLPPPLSPHRRFSPRDTPPTLEQLQSAELDDLAALERALGVDEESRAVTVIQSHVRGRNARKQRQQQRQAQYELRYDRAEEISLAKLQAHFRGRQSRQRVKSMRREQARAAASIQARYRGMRMRNTSIYSKERRKRDKAASQLQASWRGHCERKYVQSRRKKLEDDAQDAAAVSLQSRFRSHRAQKQYVVNKERRQSAKAATFLQSHFRGREARKKAHGLRREREMTNEERKRQQAVQRIQAGTRGRIARRKTNELRKRRRQSATALQSRFRGHLERKRVTEMKACHEKSATAVQSHFRGHLERKRINQRKQSATALQSQFRGHLERKRLRKLQQEQQQNQTGRTAAQVQRGGRDAVNQSLNQSNRRTVPSESAGRPTSPRNVEGEVRQSVRRNLHLLDENRVYEYDGGLPRLSRDEQERGFVNSMESRRGGDLITYQVAGSGATILNPSGVGATGAAVAAAAVSEYQQAAVRRRQPSWGRRKHRRKKRRRRVRDDDKGGRGASLFSRYASPRSPTRARRAYDPSSPRSLHNLLTGRQSVAAMANGSPPHGDSNQIGVSSLTPSLPPMGGDQSRGIALTYATAIDWADVRLVKEEGGRPSTSPSSGAGGSESLESLYRPLAMPRLLPEAFAVLAKRIRGFWRQLRFPLQQREPIVRRMAHLNKENYTLLVSHMLLLRAAHEHLVRIVNTIRQHLGEDPVGVGTGVNLTPSRPAAGSEDGGGIGSRGRVSPSLAISPMASAPRLGGGRSGRKAVSRQKGSGRKGGGGGFAQHGHPARVMTPRVVVSGRRGTRRDQWAADLSRDIAQLKGVAPWVQEFVYRGRVYS